MQIERKNVRVRKEMISNGVNQTILSKLMHISEMECSVMLKRELAKSEQDEIIRTIREWSSSKS